MTLQFITPHPDLAHHLRATNKTGQAIYVPFFMDENRRLCCDSRLASSAVGFTQLDGIERIMLKRKPENYTEGVHYQKVSASVMNERMDKWADRYFKVSSVQAARRMTQSTRKKTFLVVYLDGFLELERQPSTKSYDVLVEHMKKTTVRAGLSTDPPRNITAHAYTTKTRHAAKTTTKKSYTPPNLSAVGPSLLAKSAPKKKSIVEVPLQRPLDKNFPATFPEDYSPVGPWLLFFYNQYMSGTLTRRHSKLPNLGWQLPQIMQSVGLLDSKHEPETPLGRCFIVRSPSQVLFYHREATLSLLHKLMEHNLMDEAVTGCLPNSFRSYALIIMNRIRKVASLPQLSSDALLPLNLQERGTDTVISVLRDQSSRSSGNT